MIAFIVPVKPKEASTDWEFESLLLERTLRSICSQTTEEYKVFVIYDQKPAISFTHDHLIFKQFPYKNVPISELVDFEYVMKYYPPAYGEKMYDKGRKLTYGCKIAEEYGCHYMMGVDSDDLVSNRIATYVQENSMGNTKSGWRITKGLIYREGERMAVKKYDIQNINGSSHIIRKDLIRIPDFSENRFWLYNLFEAHGYTYGRLKDFENELLDDYPYFGTVYVIHSNNYSNVGDLLRKSSLKRVIKKAVFGKFISRRLRSEFGLYPLKAESK